MSALPLRPGEPVTLLLPDHVVLVEVTRSDRESFNVILSSRGAKTYDSRWTLEEEGITWLRGYYLPDSNEVKAARAAQGLGAPKKAATEKAATVQAMQNAQVQAQAQAQAQVSAFQALLDELATR